MKHSLRDEAAWKYECRLERERWARGQAEREAELTSRFVHEQASLRTAYVFELFFGRKPEWVDGCLVGADGITLRRVSWNGADRFQPALRCAWCGRVLDAMPEFAINSLDTLGEWLASPKAKEHHWCDNEECQRRRAEEGAQEPGS